MLATFITVDPPTAFTLAEFFVANVTTDYISHGEVLSGRAKSMTEWVDGLAAVVAEELLSGGVRVCVAVEEGNVEGMMIVRIEGSVAHMEDIIVRKGARSNGTGEVLFEALRTLARNEGVRTLMCESGTRNPRAHAFIQRLGFAPVSTVFAMEVP